MICFRCDPMEKTHIFIRQRCYFLPRLVRPGLETKHDKASSLFLYRFPDLTSKAVVQKERGSQILRTEWGGQPFISTSYTLFVTSQSIIKV